jgi:hypothetical protein
LSKPNIIEKKDDDVRGVRVWANRLGPPLLRLLVAAPNLAAEFLVWASAQILPTRHIGSSLHLGASLLTATKGRYAGRPQRLLIISRTAQLGTEIGCRDLLVHAETPQARDFYLHLIPEFEPSPTDALHLVLLMKDILRTLRD